MNQAIASVVPAVQHSMHAAGLTATGLADLLLKVDAESSASTKARLTVILDGLGNLPLKEGRDILKATVKAAKDTPTEGTIKQRISECRQLYGAVRLIEGFRKGIEDAGMGWSSSISRARAELVAAGLKANGDRIKSKEEVAAEKAVKVLGATWAENMVGVDTKDEQKVAEISAQAAKKATELGASAGQIKAQAARIVKAYGMAYAVALSDEIVNLYNATVETEADDGEAETAQAA